LEREEELREKAGFYDDSENEDDEEMHEVQRLAMKIREKKKIMAVRLLKNYIVALAAFCKFSF